MVNYDNFNKTHNLEGENVLDKLCQECSSYGKKAIVITHDNINPFLGLYARVLSLLNICGLEHVTYQIKKDSLNVDLAIEAINLAKEKEVNMVIAIGIGEIVDLAKAVASGFYLDSNSNLILNFNKINKALPILNILTSKSIMSENSGELIINNINDKTSSVNVISDLLQPKVAFIDTFYVS
jgi:alcohol dehydrogenase YqhD (iron-dependent ADH family)